MSSTGKFNRPCKYSKVAHPSRDSALVTLYKNVISRDRLRTAGPTATCQSWSLARQSVDPGTCRSFGILSRVAKDRVGTFLPFVIAIGNFRLRQHRPFVDPLIVTPTVVGCRADLRLSAHLTDDVPSSACFSAKAICASENFVLFLVHSVSWPSNHNWNFPAQSGPEIGV